MLNLYTNQSAIWEAFLGDTPNGPKYKEPVNIRGRYEEHNKLVKDSKGKEVVSKAQFFTDSPVKEQDKLLIDKRSLEVISVEINPDLYGNEVLREVYL